MTRVALSPKQLNAQAAGPATRAANAAIREAGPDTSYSPMGAAPPVLTCEGQHRVRVVVRDRHGTSHITACCYVREARESWHYAHPDDIHVFRVPSDVESIPLVGDVLDAGELGGPPFAIPFVDYLDYSHEAIIRGLREQRRLCAARHATWPDHRGRAVCGALLWSVVANGNSVEYAADEAELTPERAAELLLRALGAVWTWRSREANGLRMRETA